MLTMVDITNYVCNQIKKLRQDCGLSQTDLGVLCGWLTDEGNGSQSRVSNYEQGRAPKIDDLEKIANALDVDILELLPKRELANQELKNINALLIFEKIQSLPRKKAKALLDLIDTLAE